MRCIGTTQEHNLTGPAIHIHIYPNVSPPPKVEIFKKPNSICGSVTAVLISRFLLNLRQVNEDSAGGASVNVSQFSAPAFRIPESIIGNLGEELEHGPLEVESNDIDVYEDDVEVGGEADSAKAVVVGA